MVSFEAIHKAYEKYFVRLIERYDMDSFEDVSKLTRLMNLPPERYKLMKYTIENPRPDELAYNHFLRVTLKPGEYLFLRLLREPRPRTTIALLFRAGAGIVFLPIGLSSVVEPGHAITEDLAVLLVDYGFYMEQYDSARAVEIVQTMGLGSHSELQLPSIIFANKSDEESYIDIMSLQVFDIDNAAFNIMYNVKFNVQVFSSISIPLCDDMYCAIRTSLYLEPSSGSSITAKMLLGRYNYDSMTCTSTCYFERNVVVKRSYPFLSASIGFDGAGIARDVAIVSMSSDGVRYYKRCINGEYTTPGDNAYHDIDILSQLGVKPPVNIYYAHVRGDANTAELKLMSPTIPGAAAVEIWDFLDNEYITTRIEDLLGVTLRVLDNGSASTLRYKICLEIPEYLAPS